MTVTFVVDATIAGAEGVRADHAVRARHPRADRAFALRLLKDGRISIDGERATLTTKASAGSVIVVDVAAARLGPPAALRPPPFSVLYEREDVVIVDKAEGVAMHAGAGVDEDEELTLSRALREALGVAAAETAVCSFPGRLDRPTSGVVVACLSPSALDDIAPAWSSGAVKKEYLCLVHGRTPKEGDIEIPLAARRARLRGTGRVEDARTTFRTLAQNRRISLLLAELHTGRTHQIRRHMKAIGHPIVGDTRYGDARRDADLVDKEGAQGLMLHAWRLSHDGSVPRLPAFIVAPVPPRFRAALRGTSLVLDEALRDAGAPGLAGG